MNVSFKRKQAIADYAKRHLENLKKDAAAFRPSTVQQVVVNPKSWTIVGVRQKDRNPFTKGRKTVGWIREYECGYEGKILGYVHTDLNDRNIVDVYLDYIK